MKGIVLLGLRLGALLGSLSATLGAVSAAGDRGCRQLPIPAPVAKAQLGCSVNLHGGSMVLGANLDGAGAITPCEQGTDGTWTCGTKLTPSDGRSGDEFGRSVAIDGDWLAVGAPFASGSGVVYLFHRAGEGSVWVQSSKITASDARLGDQFGLTLALSGDTLIVSAPDQVGNAGSLSGAVYVFHREGTSWTQGQKLAASDAAPFDNFGFSLAIDGTRIVVGAPFHDGAAGNSGEAYVFEWTGTTWSQTAKLTAADAAAGDEFGSAVSVSGDRLVVGARADDVAGKVDAGSAWVFERGDGSWLPAAAHLLGEAAGDRFGAGVSISGDRLLIGALLHDGSGVESGAAYLYQRIGGMPPTWLPDGDPLPGAAAGDRFGQAVSIDGRSLLVGAYLGDVTTPGGVLLDAGTGTVCPDVPNSSPHPDLHIEKTDDLRAVSPGQTVTYTITVSNTGNLAAPAVRVTDDFSGKLQGISWCAPAEAPPCPHTGRIDQSVPLAPGERKIFKATGTVRPDATGLLANRAYARTSQQTVWADDPPDAIQTPSCTGGADLEVVKTGPATAHPGDRITYTLTVTNHGPCTATGIRLVDPTPAQLVAVGPPLPGALPDLAAGQSQSLSLQYDVRETCDPATANRATVTANETDPVPANNVSDFLTSIAQQPADLSITKTDGLTMAVPGQVLLYTITVGNPGPCPATVTVTDVVPPELTGVRWCRDTPSGPCVPFRTGDLFDVETDVAATYRVQGMVPPMFTGTIANTATVAGPPGFVDSDPSNNSATDTTQVVLPPGVTVYCKGIAGTLDAGGTVIYTFLLLNGGPNAQGDNPGPEFSDLLPAGLTPVAVSASSGVIALGNPVTWNGAIPVGGMVTITITATIAPNVLGQTFCNGATIAFDRDGDGSNESSGGVAFPCCFPVQPPNIPALSAAALGLLALVLALVALRSIGRLRRRASPGR